MLPHYLQGFMARAEPQPRTVQLPDGSKHELHFKQLPASAFRGFFNAVARRNEEEQSQAMAKLIAQSLCTPDGQAALTAEQALQLTVAAERALTDAVLDVNGLGAKAEADLGNGSPGAESSGSGTS